MKVFLVGLTSLFFVLSSCGEKSDETISKEENKAVENCYYEYSPADSKLEWTAFKFLRKAPVGGTFTTISVNGGDKTGDKIGLIENLSFSIPVSTVETKNSDRNKKIDSLFFGSFTIPETINGEVVSLGDNGKAIIAISMNGITNEVEGNYTFNDATFTYTSSIDVLNWNAGAALNALNVACEDLHTDIENGDTESKLWSDVAISFSTTLKKKCE
ncbi:MAG: YceI family protein [Lishizhenia sp.]